MTLGASDVVELITRLAWPVLIAAVVIALLPTIRKVMASRAFSVKVGGAEITVQQASDQLATQVDDLRTQVSALRTELDGLSAAGGPAEGGAVAPAGESPIAAVPRLHRVLWVDDHPENNVYERQALQRQGVDVTAAMSTAEAGTKLDSTARFDAIITDMGRTENGVDHPAAGLELVGLVRQRGLDTPVIVYASAAAVARSRDAALQAGATAATASATELLELLGKIALG